MERKMSITEKEEDTPKESRWLLIARRYKRIPILKGMNPFAILAMILCVTLAILFPQKECTCEDHFTDQKLEVMAKQGNRAVRNYLQQRDNPINCAERRRQLLQELEKEDKQGQHRP